MSGDAFRLLLEASASRPDGPDGLLGLDLSGSAALSLPGLSASVERFGVSIEIRLDLSPADGAPPVRIVPVLKPISGFQAELDVPPFGGGGYLAIHDGRELRGAFAASLGVLGVNALAVIGLERFSLLALMAAEFTPPLQLSFGLTLVGIGGLVGINRGIDDAALSAAISEGDLGRLMFPRDLVAEAPHLLAVADRCFPERPGGILVGPMLKLGWGTPTLLSATIAAIVAPAEGRTALIGRLAVTLPAEAAPLILIQAVFRGSVDGRGVEIDATINGSRILFMPMDGDLKLRMITGPKPLFALSAGGFHPNFAPPDGMGGMRRLSIDLSPNPLLLLRAEAYLAVTTQGVQFGASVEIRAGVDGFGLHGRFTIDAFIEFDPFGFEARLSASVSVECADFDVASVHLSGMIGGPAPWRVSGKAEISILFFDVEIEIPEVRWGPEPPRILTVHNPLQILREELRRPHNWSAASEPDGIVRLRRGPGDEMLLHPLARLTFRQRRIPLETELALVDGVTLPTPVRLEIVGLDGARRLTEHFVPDRFIAMDQTERLGGSGYLELTAGVEITSDSVVSGGGSERKATHEVKELKSGHFEGLVKLKNGLAVEPALVAFARPQVVAPHLEPRIPGHVAPVPEALSLTSATGMPLLAVPAWELGG
jgi:hypothetical protein